MSDHEMSSEAQTFDGTSMTLLEGAKRRQPGAWQRMVDLYGPLIFSWCRRAGVSAEDAGDLLQEVFAAVSVNLKNFRRERPGDTFRGWLRTITRNKIRDYYRRAAKSPPALGGSVAHQALQQLPDELENVDPQQEQEEIHGLFGRAVEMVRCEFKESTWQAFWQVVVEGRSSQEVAASLGTTPGAVRNSKYKVLRRLKQEMHDLLEWPEGIPAPAPEDVS